MGLPSLVVIPAFDVTAEMLEADGIHLKPSSGDSFLQHVRDSVQSVVKASEDVTLVGEVATVQSESDSDDDDVQSVANTEDRLGAILRIVKSNSKRLSSVRPLQETLVKLDERSSAFETQVRLRRQRDNLVFARIKEDADTEVNRSKENRVLVSGLPRASLGLSSHQEKKDHYLKEISSLISKACPDLNPLPAVVEVTVSLHRNQELPSVEARFETVAGALAF